MKKLLLSLSFAAAIVPLCAQTLVPEGDRQLPRRVSYDNEISLRYGAQVKSGAGMQYVAVDYARYNFYNIGFRTGLNWFTTNVGAGQYASVPMQFSWRSGRLMNKNPDADIYGHYYNG